MELSREDWERIKSQAEAMIKESRISLIHAELMLERANLEINKL